MKNSKTFTTTFQKDLFKYLMAFKINCMYDVKINKSVGLYKSINCKKFHSCLHY